MNITFINNILISYNVLKITRYNKTPKVYSWRYELGPTNLHKTEYVKPFVYFEFEDLTINLFTNTSFS